MEITKKELLYDKKSENITQLNTIYDIDRYHARVYFINTRGDVRSPNPFTHQSLYKFEDEDGNMDLVLFTKSYGISKTNKRYISDKVDFRIRIRKNGVWVTYKNKIRPFMIFDSLHSMYYGVIREKLEEVLFEKLAWYRFIREEFKHFNYSLNYFINNNLYNKKDILKHIYGFDWPLSNLLYKLDNGGALYGRSDFRNLQHYKPWIINENKFNEELILNNWGLFHDALRIAKAIDKKINMRWSKARLEKEHVDMSMEMVHIIYQYDESTLDNKACYVNFADMSGYKMVTTMKELAVEGITKMHCVVSYKDYINNHRSSIFAIGEYTLELGEDVDGLYIKQFRGYKNCKVPDALNQEVIDKLAKFNKHFYKSDEYVVGDKNYDYDLPF